MCEKTNMPPTGPQLVHAIKRNFGGLREENLDPEKIFWELLPRDIEEPPDLTNIPHHVHSALYSNCIPVELLNDLLFLSASAFCESR